jgi:hypothetical protein
MVALLLLFFLLYRKTLHFLTLQNFINKNYLKIYFLKIFDLQFILYVRIYLFQILKL